MWWGDRWGRYSPFPALSPSCPYSNPLLSLGSSVVKCTCPAHGLLVTAHASLTPPLTSTPPRAPVVTHRPVGCGNLSVCGYLRIYKLVE